MTDSPRPIPENGFLFADNPAPQPRPAAPAGSAGHRARVRERLLTAGPNALAEHELIEMILFTALPRRDTKTIAKALLTRFGSFAKVITAPVNELLGIDGLGEAGAASLKTVQAAATRLLQADLHDTPVLASWDALIAYLTGALARERTEQLRVLFLDSKNRLLADKVLGQGTINHTPTYPREIVKEALALHATSLILVHNHPSGDPTPSAADIQTTRDIQRACTPLDILLHDHIIMGNGAWTSMKREKLF